MANLLVHAEVGDPYFDMENPWFQSLVVGHHGLVEPQVAQVRARGVNVFRYVNLWTAPEPSWVGRGNPLHDYMDRMVREGSLYFKDTYGEPARTPEFPDFGPRIIINWGMATTLQVTGFVQFLLSLDPGGILIDQVYYRPDWWWFGARGPNFNMMNLLIILRYEIVMRQLLTLLQGNRPTIINGSHEIPGTLYLENSQAHWQENTSLWSGSNVFSVESSHVSTCQEAVRQWLTKKDRWLAFTYTGTNRPFRDAAYEHAVSERDKLQGGSHGVEANRSGTVPAVPVVSPGEGSP